MRRDDRDRLYDDRMLPPPTRPAKSRRTVPIRTPRALATSYDPYAFSFPSPPPIGTAIMVKEHPFILVGVETRDTSSGTKTTLRWDSHCERCGSRYQPVSNLYGRITKRCEECRPKRTQDAE